MSNYDPYLAPTAFAQEAIAVSNTAIGLDADTFAGSGRRPACRAIITCETGNVRVTWHGEDPTSSAGHLMLVGDQLVLEGPGNLRQFKAIRVTVDAALIVTYEH